MPRAAHAILCALILGCASGSGTAATTSGATPRRSLTVITEAEIAENPGILFTHELITRLRPNFLRSTQGINGNARGVQVRVDNGPQREVADLANIDVRQVREIRFFSPQEANVRFGVDTNVPVISVTLKRLK